LEIIVIDQASSDGTKQQVRSWTRDHPKSKLRLVAQRTLKQDVDAEVRKVYAQYGKGEIALTLPATMSVEAQALRQAVDHLNRQPEIAGVQPATLVRHDYQFVGLLQQYLALLRQRTLKMRFCARRQTKPLALWRRQAFIKPVEAGQIYYAADVVVYRQPISLRTISRQQPHLRWFHIFPVVIVPLLLSYCLYLATSLREPQLLVWSWLAAAAWFGWAIWQNQLLSWQQKLYYSAGIPLTYLPLYIYAVLRLFSIGRIRISADQ
jgi:hypothetical protein